MASYEERDLFQPLYNLFGGRDSVTEAVNNQKENYFQYPPGKKVDIKAILNFLRGNVGKYQQFAVWSPSIRQRNGRRTPVKSVLEYYEGYPDSNDDKADWERIYVNAKNDLKRRRAAIEKMKTQSLDELPKDGLPKDGLPKKVYYESRKFVTCCKLVIFFIDGRSLVKDEFYDFLSEVVQYSYRKDVTNVNLFNEVIEGKRGYEEFLSLVDRSIDIGK
jgi:hypothetical protein